MNCFPGCEVSLPKIGKSLITSKLDICKSPTVLTLSITTDGKRSASSFVAGNQQEYRTIGNEYWPLQLQVKFRNSVEGGYYADACIHTVRTANTTCFMSGFIDSSVVDSGCGNHRTHNNNGFPIIILCVILATCLLMVSVAVIAMFHRLYVSHKSKDNRKPSYCNRKTSNGNYPTFFDPGFNACSKYPHDERLAVIDEVDEKDNDCLSIASTGFDSGHVRSVSEDEWTRHTDLSTDTRIAAPYQPMPTIFPGEYHRRQSQPLANTFPQTLESFKPRYSLPFVQNSS